MAVVPGDYITPLCYFIGGAEVETAITHYIHVYITLESTRKTDVGEYVFLLMCGFLWLLCVVMVSYSLDPVINVILAIDKLLVEEFILGTHLSN